jgi:hypothetical protein
VKVISRERLKELIEKEEPIYVVKYGDYEKKQINKHITHDFYDDCIMWWGYLPRKEWKYEHCFETEEEAKWYCEFGCIERTERLELPTWEEFIEMGTTGFISKVGIDMELAVWYDSTTDFDKKSIKITNTNDYKVRWFDKPLTKENYIIACRKAKELFLGDSDGDIR